MHTLDKLSRRSAIKAFGALGALGAGLHARGVLAAGDRLVTRRNLASPEAAEDLATYRDGVAGLMSRPANDPLNWINIANIHRDHCPHHNWFFLPWHRAYLAMLEAAIRSQTGKTDFALPYWNWTTDPHLPAPFVAETLPDGQPNPLYHSPRAITSTGPTIPATYVGPVAMATVYAQPSFPTFGSFMPKGQDSIDPKWQRQFSTAGLLESIPHDNVHDWVGGDMGQVPVSARDPIFYMHHCNIDRAWANWTDAGHHDPNDRLWSSFVFVDNFYAPNGSSYNVVVNQMVDYRKLGYRYPLAGDAEALVAARGQSNGGPLVAVGAVSVAPAAAPGTPLSIPLPAAAKGLQATAGASPLYAQLIGVKPLRGETASIGAYLVGGDGPFDPAEAVMVGNLTFFAATMTGVPSMPDELDYLLDLTAGMTKLGNPANPHLVLVPRDLATGAVLPTDTVSVARIEFLRQE